MAGATPQGGCQGRGLTPGITTCYFAVSARRFPRTGDRGLPFYADLHIHSKYSRATSRDCDLEHLAWWARRKGVTVVGTGDFTHPDTLRNTYFFLKPTFLVRRSLPALILGDHITCDQLCLLKEVLTRHTCRDISRRQFTSGLKRTPSANR